jgi:hypothetical protein
MEDFTLTFNERSKRQIYVNDLKKLKYYNENID